MQITAQKKNYTVIRFSDQKEILFSYSMPVAGKINGQWYRVSAFHSTTTNNHIKEYLGGRDAIPVGQSFFDEAKGAM